MLISLRRKNDYETAVVIYESTTKRYNKGIQIEIRDRLKVRNT